MLRLNQNIPLGFYGLKMGVQKAPLKRKSLLHAECRDQAGLWAAPLAAHRRLRGQHRRPRNRLPLIRRGNSGRAAALPPRDQPTPSRAPTAAVLRRALGEAPPAPGGVGAPSWIRCPRGRVSRLRCAWRKSPSKTRAGLGLPRLKALVPQVLVGPSWLLPAPPAALTLRPRVLGSHHARTLPSRRAESGARKEGGDGGPGLLARQRGRQRPGDSAELGPESVERAPEGVRRPGGQVSADQLRCPRGAGGTLRPGLNRAAETGSGNATR